MKRTCNAATNTIWFIYITVGGAADGGDIQCVVMSSSDIGEINVLVRSILRYKCFRGVVTIRFTNQTDSIGADDSIWTFEVESDIRCRFITLTV